MGIRTGGAFLAQRLADRISRRTDKPMRVGVLDITLYRDDWTQLSHKPLVGKTELPGSIDDQEVVLVDDVLFTGRTIRAALDALIDYGRPRRIELAVLVDRGGRELPIQPDYRRPGRQAAPGPAGQRLSDRDGTARRSGHRIGSAGQVLMERQKKAGARGAAGPAALDPEARVRLERQVAGVAAVLAADGGLAALQEQVTADPRGP